MSGLLVVCLCAEWCGTCREYRPEFVALSREFPQHRFIWIDIEDEGDLVAHLDIENFPTLLVAQDDAVLFAGVMLPQIGRLRRLLQALDVDATPQLGALPADELAVFRELLVLLHDR